MTRRALLLMLAVTPVLAACTTAEGPTEPVWGKQPCAHCAMVLSERRFGAQLLTSDGDRFFFDDPGCMVLFNEDRALAGARTWVYDDGAGRWLDARAAHYAAGATTPMDFGFEANGGGGLGWNELRAQVLQKGKVAR